MTAGLEAGELRERVPYWVVIHRCYTKKVLHVPARESTRDDPETVCTRVTHSNHWVAKDTDVIPPGYFPICKDCRRLLEESSRAATEN